MEPKPRLLVEPVTLENRFVRLEPVEPRHREPLRAAGADPGLWAYAMVNQHGRDFDAWFEMTLDHRASGEGLPFAVIDRQSGGVVGSSRYMAIVPEHRRLEIGWTWFASSVWGGPVNPSAKRLMLGHAFEALNCLRVEFKRDARNVRSGAALEKLGAPAEGTLRSHLILPDGHRRDSTYHAILVEDWPAVRSRLEARLAAFGPTRP